MLSVAPQQQETQYVTILHREPAEGLMVVSDAGKTLWRDRYGTIQPRCYEYPGQTIGQPC